MALSSMAVVAENSEMEQARAHLSSAARAPQSIAPMPRVCTELAALAAKDSTDASQYAKLIQTDPALAGEILRYANSPALRPRNPVTSLQQAVSWLGIAEVRNTTSAIMLRGEVFNAPGHERESEEFWREASVAGLWAKELARMRRRHVESAFLTALMHRAGAALALKILSRYEQDQKRSLAAESFDALIAEFEPIFGPLLMRSWRVPADVQRAVMDWRNYAASEQLELAATAFASHVCALHTLHGDVVTEEMVLECPALESLGLFPHQRAALLEKRQAISEQAGLSA